MMEEESVSGGRLMAPKRSDLSARLDEWTAYAGRCRKRGELLAITPNEMDELITAYRSVEAKVGGERDRALEEENERLRAALKTIDAMPHYTLANLGNAAFVDSLHKRYEFALELAQTALKSPAKEG